MSFEEHIKAIAERTGIKEQTVELIFKGKKYEKFFRQYEQTIKDLVTRLKHEHGPVGIPGYLLQIFTN